MTQEKSGSKNLAEASSTPTPMTGASGDAPSDVTSDPALDDQIGSDWSDEGGATPTGPAAPGHD
jgi:hypothetical protein